MLKPRHNEVKSDVYSMGMTLLHAATLRNNVNCYDFDRFKINFSVIDSKLDSVSRRYTTEFSSFLREILMESE